MSRSIVLRAAWLAWVCGSCLYPLVAGAVAPVWTETHKLIPGEHGAPGDFGFELFGSALDIEGGRVLVGAPFDNQVADAAGAGYLFNAHSGSFLQKLTYVGTSSFDGLGQSVALDGNTGLLASPITSNNPGGIVQRFSVLTGTRTNALLPGGIGVVDSFGGSVALNGTTALVGAPGDEDNGALAGAAYLINAATNQLIAKLLPQDGQSLDAFGTSVDVDGNLALVGTSSNNLTVGGAYLFDATTGEQIAKLTPSDGAVTDRFGNAVAIHSNFAVVGSRFADANGANSGAAYLFDISDPNNPQELFKWAPADINPGSGFGVSVDISQNYAIVGTEIQQTPGITVGSAYLFDIHTGSLVAKLLPSNQSIAGSFGASVAIEGSIAAVGAPYDNPNGLSPGAVYVYSIPEPESLALLVLAMGFGCWRRFADLS